jgi:predicted AAA+ superfamily ATPase
MDAAQNIVARHLQAAVDEALADTPVVCLLGPRQCGKSTLAEHQSADRLYYSLDDLNLLDAARSDPVGFIQQMPGRVTIDEIQRVPELLLTIKRQVDSNRQSGRFLLTGSANLLQMPRLADSLAGRMECLHLHPFTEAEKAEVPGRFLADWLAGIARLILMTVRENMALEFWVKRNTDPYARDMKDIMDVASLWQQINSDNLGDMDLDIYVELASMSPVTEDVERNSWNQTLSLITNPNVLSILGQSEVLMRKTLSLYGIRSEKEIREIMQIAQNVAQAQAQAAGAEAGAAAAEAEAAGGGNPEVAAMASMDPAAAMMGGQ